MAKPTTPDRLSDALAYAKTIERGAIERHAAKRLADGRKATGKRRERMSHAMTRGTHTDQEWQAVLSLYGHRCCACGSKERLSKDHIVAVSQGGSDGADNLQPLCVSCNATKSARGDDYRWDNGEWIGVAVMECGGFR